MPRYAVKVYYDGRGFYGFQPQKDRRTVGGEILAALQRSALIADCTSARFQAASRTDRGVSALSQTIAFDTGENFSLQRLNAFLPKDIRAWAWTEVSPSFNPRRDAEERHYVYVASSDGCDLDAVKDAAGMLVERCSFGRYLDPSGRLRTKRLRKLKVTRRGGCLVLHFHAKSFERNLILKLTSLLLRVGWGQMAFNVLRMSLDAGGGLPLGVPPAPPEPLLLFDIKYGFKFQVDEAARVELISWLQRQVLEGEVKRLCLWRLT